MNYFSKADQVDGTQVANEYAGRSARLLQENILLKLQLRQHIDREKNLLEIIKKDLPEFYKTLEKTSAKKKS